MAEIKTSVRCPGQQRYPVLITRRGCDEADHPRANEEYFKVQLGGLEKLSAPITTDKWKRLTFLYSTGEYLLNAKTLNDLVVEGEERESLWKSLRERAAADQGYQADLPEVNIPPEVLAALLGIKELQAGYETPDPTGEPDA